MAKAKKKAGKKLKVEKLSASQVLAALEESFDSKWVTFSEVKDGPTGGGLRQMDFVAIKKTWSPITIAAVEIKVSRSDYTADEKWPHYMALCNQFYWACPAGLISRTEIDDNCGLIWIRNGKARVMKRAAYRQKDPDPMMLLYLILWRINARDSYLGGRTREETMRAIQKEMEDKADLGERYGYFIAESMRKANGMVVEAKATAETVILRYKKLMEGLPELVEYLEQHYTSGAQILESLKRVEGIYRLRQIRVRISNCQDALNELAEMVADKEKT